MAGGGRRAHYALSTAVAKGDLPGEASAGGAEARGGEGGGGEMSSTQRRGAAAETLGPANTTFRDLTPPANTKHTHGTGCCYCQQVATPTPTFFSRSRKRGQQRSSTSQARMFRFPPAAAQCTGSWKQKKRQNKTEKAGAKQITEGRGGGGQCFGVTRGSGLAQERVEVLSEVAGLDFVLIAPSLIFTSIFSLNHLEQGTPCPWRPAVQTLRLLWRRR